MNSQNSTHPNDSSHEWTLADLTFVDPELWGLSFERHTKATAAPAHPPHIAVERLGTVEGLLVLARCTACGGRHERLLDLRVLSNTERHDVDAAIIAMEASADATTVQWAAGHAHCAAAPRQHDACFEVERLLQMQYATAVADVRAGEPLANELLVIMDDCSTIALRLADLPSADGGDRGRARTMATHAFHAMVREHARRTGTRPLAAVFVGNAWPSTLIGDGVVAPTQTEDSGQLEFLTAMAATPEAVMLGIAPITRDTGVVGAGPGEVGGLTFDLVKTACPLTDGPFASSCVS